METKKEKNKIALEQISFHLDEVMKFCSQLNLSELAPLEHGEWDHRIKTCKDAIGFCKESVQQLSKILE
jgi:hypothetical protein